jgi:Na+/H+ antiporter NhaD/arsenite permease-like protein
LKLQFPRSRSKYAIRIPIDLRTAPVAVILILWAAQCLGPPEIRNGIVGTEGIKPYNILILFFSLAYMTITLDVTGLLQAAAFWVCNKGGSNTWKLYFYFYLMLTLLSVVVGNDPVILSGTVFLVYYTKAVNLDPLAWLIAEFAAANTASMVLFVGNPTNVVICEGFQINNVVYSAYTIFPFLACITLSLFALAYQFRDKKYIPRRLPFTGHLDPRTAIKDSVSAWVGSILLITCLLVILIVSFFIRIDVWMISLPFAFVKFLFDLSWDHWKYVHREREVKEKKAMPNGTVDAVTNGVANGGHHHPDPDAGLQQLIRSYTFNSGSHPSTLPSSHPTVDSSARLTRPIIATLLRRTDSEMSELDYSLEQHFPTLYTAFPRLPFALVPFAFSQFILIEALAHQGWIDVFAVWLSRATGNKIYPTVWIVGVFGVLMCNLAGTNIGATILLTKVVRAVPGLPRSSTVAAAIALAVASNIGAVSFTFSASLAGLLWRGILEQKGIHTIRQRDFARWNLLPVIVMTSAGLAVVCAEMAVLYHR